MRPSPIRPNPLVGALLAPIVGASLLLAPAARAGEDDPAVPAIETDADTGDYDPWVPFNERMFAFNHGVLDRFAVKPAATAWDTVLPDPAQRSLDRAFDNVRMPRRLLNHLLQGRPLAAGVQVARFLVNTTAGVAGFLDVATMIRLERSDADMGQTFGVYGVGPGPYLVLPFLPPLTVRDGIGRAIDGALDPLGYFTPFLAGTILGAVQTVNERSLRLRLFSEVEDGSLDLYSAVRNGYLQRRRRAIEARRVPRLEHAETVAAPAPGDDT